jgi:hypothetical protein
MSQVVQDLIAARAAIANPTAWLKSKLCNASRPQISTAFCARGAILYATGCAQSWWDAIHGTREMQADALLARVLPADFIPVRGHSPVPDYNGRPTTTHKDILDLFDRAIALAIKEAAAAEQSGISRVAAPTVALTSSISRTAPRPSALVRIASRVKRLLADVA